MSLVERITQALEGTPSLPWKLDQFQDVVDEGDIVRADRPTVEDARLIAEAPGLLAECAERLHTPPRPEGATGTDTEWLADLIGIQRRDGCTAAELTGFTCNAGHARCINCELMDLLAQVFLDPQETNQ